MTAASNALATCAHCGLTCDAGAVTSPRGTFCCQGCAAVYQLLEDRRLVAYYELDARPGVSQKGRDTRADRFVALDDPEIAARLVRFDDGNWARAAFPVPDVHCASCVWLLEQLWRMDPGVTRTEVDLQRQIVSVDYRPQRTSVRKIAERLAAMGYEPVLENERTPGQPPASRRRLYQQLGVAGFAFGNIMLFSIPRYANGGRLTGGFQPLFDILNLAFSAPVLLFGAGSYFAGAWRAVRSRTVTIDVPVALGLLVLFSRSVFDIAAGRGPGFFDSFTGLVFFLLVGRLFQQKAFERLAFDRTYRSFLPLVVHVERAGSQAAVPVGELRPGDRLVLRNREVVPADAVLLDDQGAVDYRVLTGEETPVVVRAGERIRAGGRAACAMRVTVLRTASESELAALWANPLFGEEKRSWLIDAASRFGKWFTVAAIGLAAAGVVAWWPDLGAAANVATAVLIVACPCALTLAAPITFGTAMGLLGRRGLYLKDAGAVLGLSRIDTIVFDKTGTLTTGRSLRVCDASPLSDRDWASIRRLALESTHPVSRAIAAVHPAGAGALIATTPPPVGVTDTPGQGLTGMIDGRRVAIGSAAFVAALTERPTGSPDRTYVLAGDEVGWVRVSGAPRDGVEDASAVLAGDHRLLLVSGDSEREAERWTGLFGARMFFRSGPVDKLAIVTSERQRGHRVLMVGDGLNDAGALRAADVGLAVCDDSACVVPACDGVIGGDRLAELPGILRFARLARAIVTACFVVSLGYNAIGLSLALTGALTPLASAILMPVSSLTIVGLSAGGVRWAARRALRP